ncbi:substrate-binding periplasmic protein [Vibrio neptunius]|uniref:substrate-binding periplasmic protein n=1 Tax=Vibrio neptunius TaxID=170651 RepID=UPI0019D2FB0E|nr:transporter substrate-binding domain-containing protein [Vibrio neptunius]MBN3573545.1 transporter substrate-binding domain-containing protein [Vibrio neptunius]
MASTTSWKELIWITEEYPPWTYSDNGVASGIYIELLEAIWEKKNVERTRHEIQVLPWARGFKHLQTVPGTVLFSMSSTSAREQLGFLWVGPVLIENRIALIAKKGRFDNLTTMEAINATFDSDTIGVVNKDSGENFFLENGGADVLLHKVHSGEQLVRMLQYDRVDAISYAMFSTHQYLEKLGESFSDYEVLLYLSPVGNGGYFALHKDTDPRLVASFQEAFDQLQHEGFIKDLAEKYAPK